MRTTVPAALAVALIVGACGNGDSADDATSTSTLAQASTSAPTTTTQRPEAEPSTTSTTPQDGIQLGNPQPTAPLTIQPSTVLPTDVRLGVGLYPAYPDMSGFGPLLSEFVESGVHRIDISYSDIEYPVDWGYSETEIDPEFDQFVDDLNDQNIAINYKIHFWDKEGHAAGETLATPRFQTEEQIQDFLDYVSLIVERYRGRIQYYTLWSEPDACGGGGIKCIEPADYLALAEKVIPLIRQLDPDAKVALAPVVLFYARDYMASLLESDVVAEFDVIQWHGIYNVTPGDTEIGRYYDDYPTIAATIKDTAAANGFEGEYWSTEITFCSRDYDSGCPSPDPPLSDLQTAKYYARSILLHVGMDIGTSYKTYRDTTGPITFATFGRLHTLLSGTTPLDIAVEVETEVSDMVTAGFATSSDQELVALWDDTAASEERLRTAATLIFAGKAGGTAWGIDVVGGVQQQLVTTDDGQDLVVSDLLIGDGPVIIRLEGIGNEG